jgi:hypothetical protein
MGWDQPVLPRLFAAAAVLFDTEFLTKDVVISEIVRGIMRCPDDGA